MGGPGLRESAGAEGKKYLIIGGDGQLGSAVARCLKERGRTVLRTTRRRPSVSAGAFYLDLRDGLRLGDLPLAPDTVFLCGAETSLMRCEEDPEGTRYVNVEQTLRVVDQLLCAGIRVVYPSTNLVFDGRGPFVRATAPLSPITEYGRQKAAVERHLMGGAERAVIVRLTKVIDRSLPLIRLWMQALAGNRAIEAYANWLVSPVSLSFAVDAMIRMADEEAGGVWQVSGREEITYHELAVELAVAGGWNSALVSPARGEGRLSPCHGSLDTTRMERELGLCPPRAIETVAEVVMEAKGASL